MCHQINERLLPLVISLTQSIWFRCLSLLFLFLLLFVWVSVKSLSHSVPDPVSVFLSLTGSLSVFLFVYYPEHSIRYDLVVNALANTCLRLERKKQNTKKGLIQNGGKADWFIFYFFTMLGLFFALKYSLSSSAARRNTCTLLRWLRLFLPMEYLILLGSHFFFFFFLLFFFFYFPIKIISGSRKFCFLFP